MSAPSMPSTPKIDLHAHVIPDKWPNLKERYGYGGWIEIKHESDKTAVLSYDDGRFFRRIESNCWSVEDRIADMDKTGVTVQALSSTPVLFGYSAKPDDALDFNRLQNDFVASMVNQRPDRFVDRALDPFYKTVQELGVGLFVHPWDMPPSKRYDKYWMQWLVGMPAETTAAICEVMFGGLLERFPRLKLCFAHGGGSLPYTVGRIQHGFDVRPDLCAVDNKIPPKSYLGDLYADSLVHSHGSLRLLLDVLGEDRVMLGSDYPYPLGEIERPGRLIETSGLQDSLKEKLLWKNAASFLGIEMTPEGASSRT
ncbi:hypothetical protein MRX96_008631 [Rhipicephalus microplus]